MNEAIKMVAALVVGIALGAVLTGATKSEELKGVTIEDETFKGTVTVEGALTAATDLTVTDDLTVSGGALDVTTSNTSTSSVTVGCIDTTATSTATRVKIVLGKDTSTATTTLYGDTSRGAVYWAFGTCSQ